MTVFRNAVALARSVLVAGVFLTGLAAACGDDDQEDRSDGTLGTSAATTDATVTTDEFIRQVNGICQTDADRRQQAAEQVFTDWPLTTAEQRETFLRMSGDIAEDSRPAIEALHPPEEAQVQYDQYVAEAGAAFEELTADPDLLLQEEDPFAASNALADEIGLTDCTVEWTPLAGV